MKLCPECRQTKSLDQFHKSASHKSNASPRCIPCSIKVSSEWYKENKDRKRSYDANHRARRRAECRAASKKFRQHRKDRKNADTSVRRDRVKQSTPLWANKFFMRQAYELAALRTKMFGFDWEVDHIVPLRGRYVSGLHVETNLQVIPKVINAAKTNHYSLEHEGRK